jgi:serine/threonine protein kinase/tetratricopeptide (TPR) repeat protein
MAEQRHDSQSRDDSIRGILADWGVGETDDGTPQSAGPDARFSWKKLTDRESQLAPDSNSESHPLTSEALLHDFELGVPEIESQRHGPDRDLVNAEPASQLSTKAPERGYGRQRCVPSPSYGWPRPSDSVGGFHIVLELGRGAFARVYLATELNLGQRLVAIKVSQPEGDEPQILAQLQHTHIVPVHSVCDDRTTGLRVLCMPYFGGANLAEVLAAAGGLEPTLRDGRSLVAALDHVGRNVSGVPSRVSVPKTLGPPLSAGESARGESPLTDISNATPPAPLVNSFPIRSLFSRLIRIRPPSPSALIERDARHSQPFREYLHRASAVHAAVWIMARLAEGLEHAHGRGLLHRDLKPSNILLASDGTPMLLDFNLAARTQIEPIEDEARRALIGGTLPYMSPEHLDAFNPRGSTVPEAVDERSDIYAMGLILYEMLAGERPFAEPTANLPMPQALEEMYSARRHPPSLRAHSPRVPWSLDALVAKCLRFDPARRYKRAGDLAEDLRRYLDNLPMKHCPEPSLRERLAKLAKRHPTLCGTTSIAIICGLFMSVLVGTTVLVYDKMQDLGARVRLRLFDRDFTECQFLLNTVGSSRETLNKGITSARKTLDDLGVGAGSEPRVSEWMRRLTSTEQYHLREQIAELITSGARASIMLATDRGSEGDLRKAYKAALASLDRAERIAPAVPAALYAERALYHARLGEAELAQADSQMAASIVPTTCHDLTLLGSTLLARGDHVRAEEALRQALKLDQTSFWTWFLLGHCHYAQRRFLESAGDFSVCAVRGPTLSWAHFNRGLALAKAGRLKAAQDAYDNALTIEPDFPEALVNRALVELELNQLDAAQADLERAIAKGRDDVAVLAALGEIFARQGRRDAAEQYFASLLARDPSNLVVLSARGILRSSDDPEAARSDLTKALAIDPRNAHAHYGMAILTRPSDPHAALKHLDASIESDPNLTDALQLRALVRARLGRREALDDVDRLVESPTSLRLYNAACAIAIYGRESGDRRPLRHGLELLARALESGFSPQDAAADPDLQAMRTLPEYAQLLAQYQKTQ